MAEILFINPMGRGTLKAYDLSILNHVDVKNVVYFTDIKEQNSVPGLTTIPHYSYADKKGPVKVYEYLKNQFGLYSYCKKHKPKAIHFQWLKIPSIDLFLLKKIKALNIAVIFTAHNLLPHDSGQSQLRNYQKIYSLCDRIIVHTEATKKELIDLFQISEQKIKVVEHGLLEVPNYTEPEVEKCRQQLHDELDLDQKVVFSFLGNLSKYKGVDLLADTWERGDFENKSNIHLILAGRCEDAVAERFKKFKNVSVRGAVDDNEFLGIIRLSNYVLLPYLKISQSGLLLTVLNQRKKVIVSNKGGLTDPFQFGNIGYILEELNAKNFEKTLLKAVASVNEEPAAEVWEQIEHKYDWKIIGKKTQLIYSQYLG